MGVKQIPAKVFKKFLKSKGLKFIRKNSSHDLWDYPDESLPRPVTIQRPYKDIPLTHIHTNLRTMRVSKKEFEKWLKG